MSKPSQYILNELKVIEKECMEKGISTSEWIERHAEEYRRKYGNGSMQKGDLVKKNHGNKSRWAAWLERVNNM